MFAFEGPRVNDEVDTFEGEVGNELEVPIEGKRKDRKIRIVDTISIRSKRLPMEKSLPAMAQQVI